MTSTRQRRLPLELATPHDARWVPLAAPRPGRSAEFFAGIGLMRLGLEQAGWTVAFANDISERKQAAYAAHFGASHEFHLGDIHALDPEQIPSCDLATASFPCTDLSIAGGRRGIHSGESSAFWGFIHILQGLGERRPPLLLIENVTGFLTSHGGSDFHAAMQALSELGYGVDPFVLDARWFTPQSRPRLFVVGRLGAPRGLPRPLAPSQLRPRVLVEAVQRFAESVHWSLADLPAPPASSPRTLKDIVEPLPEDAPEWWSTERVEYLFQQMSDKHRALAEEMRCSDDWNYGTIFRRVRRQADGTKRSMAELRCDGVAGCLRTPKGGSGRQILWRAGRGRHRARLLSPRECARLMGADAYQVSGSLNEALFGFGDAVCVPAVSWIATHALRRPAM